MGEAANEQGSRSAMTVYVDPDTKNRFEDLRAKCSKQISLSQTQLIEFCIKQTLDKYQANPRQLVLALVGTDED